MGLIIGISRIALPVLTVIIITKCMLSLLLGHPQDKIYGYIVDMVDGEKYALNMWETSIGRSTLCDIVIGYDTVSRHHAVISRRIDGWHIFDLDSKAGILINGAKPEKNATVQNGDVLTFGNANFKFLVANDPVQAVGRRSKHKTDKSPFAQYGPAQAQPMPSQNQYGTPQPAQNNVPHTDQTGDPAIINPQTGAIVVLRGNLVTLGRSSTCDLTLPSPAVSRKHANLVLYEDGWAIEDAGSSSGTFLNGERVTSPQLLFDGDEITLADTKLTFSVLSRTYY